MTGFSKHMLDYLEREQIYVSSGNPTKGRGNRRLYNYADIVLLRALKTICDDVGKIRHLKMSLDAFKQRYGGLQPGMSPGAFLIARRGKLYVKNGSLVEETVTGQQAFSFVVDMSAVTKSLESKFSNLEISFNLKNNVLRQAEEIRQRHWAPIQQRRATKQSLAI